jgi:hypothetical protein
MRDDVDVGIDGEILRFERIRVHHQGHSVLVRRLTHFRDQRWSDHRQSALRTDPPPKYVFTPDTTGRFDDRNRGGRGVCSQLSALGALDGCSGSFLCITEYAGTDLLATTPRGPKHASIVMTTPTHPTSSEARKAVKLGFFMKFSRDV